MTSRELQLVAILFVAVLVVFFMVLVLIGKKLDVAAFTIVRFLSAICAGFAGGLFLGSINVGFTIEGRIAVSAAGGAGCFALIWLTFGTQALQGEWYHFAIPDLWTLQQAAVAMAQQDGARVIFDPAFKPEELGAQLVPGVVKARNLKGALEKLSSRTKTALRKVVVSQTPPADYELKPV